MDYDAHCHLSLASFWMTDRRRRWRTALDLPRNGNRVERNIVHRRKRHPWVRFLFFYFVLFCFSFFCLCLFSRSAGDRRSFLRHLLARPAFVSAQTDAKTRDVLGLGKSFQRAARVSCHFNPSTWSNGAHSRAPSQTTGGEPVLG